MIDKKIIINEILNDIKVVVENIYNDIFFVKNKINNIISKKIKIYIEKYIRNREIDDEEDIDTEEITSLFEIADYMIVQELSMVIKNAFKKSKYLNPDIKIYLSETTDDLANIDVILFEDPDIENTIVMGEFDKFFIRKKKGIKVKFLISLYLRRFYLIYCFFGLNNKDFKYFASLLSTIIAHELRHLYQRLKISLGKDFYNKFSDLTNKLASKIYVDFSEDIDKYFSQGTELDAYAFNLAFHLYLIYNGNINIIRKKIESVLNSQNKDDTKDVSLLVSYVSRWGKNSDIVKKLVKKIFIFLNKFKEDDSNS